MSRMICRPTCADFLSALLSALGRAKSARTGNSFGALVHSRSVRRPYMRRLAQATAEDSLQTAIDDRIPNVALERAVAPVTSPTSAGARIGLLFEKARKMCGVSRKRLGRFLRLFVWLP